MARLVGTVIGVPVAGAAVGLEVALGGGLGEALGLADGGGVGATVCGGVGASVAGVGAAVAAACTVMVPCIVEWIMQ
jgi:hypothetical protein